MLLLLPGGKGSMPIPLFTIDGVIPPFVGADGPGGAPQNSTPYAVTPIEVASTLGDTSRRAEIIRDWLEHRRLLRGLGVTSGFQWLDGSFVEQKEPSDLDVVTFFRRPAGARSAPEIEALWRANPEVFQRQPVRSKRRLDAFFIDLDAASEAIVDQSRYYFGLFSHRREDFLWKGMLRASLTDEDDDPALAVLGSGCAGEMETVDMGFVGTEAVDGEQASG